MQREIQSMLEKHGIEDTTPRGRGFISTVFLVPKEHGGNKLEILELVCVHRTLQDGRDPCLERDQSRILDGKSRSKGRLFYASSPGEGQSILEVLVQRTDLPVQVTTVWSGVHPLGLHQDPKANRHSAETTRCAINRLHRRHTNPGRVQGAGSGTRHRPGVLTGKPGLCSKPGEICQLKLMQSIEFLWVLNRQREGEEDQSRHTSPPRRQAGVDQGSVPVIGRASGGYQGSTPRATVLLQTSANVEMWTRTLKPGLLNAVATFHRGNGGAAVVARPPNGLGQQNDSPVGDNRIGRLHSRVGCDLRGYTRWQPVVSRGELERFFSWRPDPDAEGLDAFNQDWTSLKGKGYANPP